MTYSSARPQTPTPSRSLRALAVSALALSAFGLTGCSALAQLLPGSQPVRDAETGEITERQDNADVFELKVGDCTDTDETLVDEATSIPVVPCGDPHADEVYFSYDVESDEFPGEDAILGEAQERCVAEFAGFIGIDYMESELEIWPMYPTQGSWSQGDREVLCLVYDPVQDTTGSLRGSAR